MHAFLLLSPWEKKTFSILKVEYNNHVGDLSVCSIKSMKGKNHLQFSVGWRGKYWTCSYTPLALSQPKLFISFPSPLLRVAWQSSHPHSLFCAKIRWMLSEVPSKPPTKVLTSNLQLMYFLLYFSPSQTNDNYVDPCYSQMLSWVGTSRCLHVCSLSMTLVRTQDYDYE